MLIITPKDVVNARFTGSTFRNTQMEMFLRCIVVTQFKMNPDGWTPFSWSEYVAQCDHQPISSEHELLEAMVHGNAVALNVLGRAKLVNIEAGYLTKDGDNRYAVTDKLLEEMARHV